jgi:hypothetical protein
LPQKIVLGCVAISQRNSQINLNSFSVANIGKLPYNVGMYIHTVVNFCDELMRKVMLLQKVVYKFFNTLLNM